MFLSVFDGASLNVKNRKIFARNISDPYFQGGKQAHTNFKRSTNANDHANTSRCYHCTH